MLIPNKIATDIALKDQYFDLKGLSVYASLGISSLRYHIRESGLPVYCIRNSEGKVTKVLVKRSEFDQWMQHRWRDELDEIASEVVAEVMGAQT